MDAHDAREHDGTAQRFTRKLARKASGQPEAPVD
jgi:hypothetical protein